MCRFVCACRQLWHPSMYVCSAWYMAVILLFGFHRMCVNHVISHVFFSSLSLFLSHFLMLILFSVLMLSSNQLPPSLSLSLVFDAISSKHILSLTLFRIIACHKLISSLLGSFHWSKQLSHWHMKCDARDIIYLVGLKKKKKFHVNTKAYRRNGDVGKWNRFS